MCTMYPDLLPTSTRQATTSKAEITLYDRLSQQLDKNWTVFYHISWLGQATGNTPIDGEADFIIAHPQYGALVVEVKGGRIYYNGSKRQWFSIDRNETHHPIDPFNQAVKSKHALIDKIIQSGYWQGGYIELFHCVAFTDVVVQTSELPPEAPSEIIIDKDNLSNLPRALARIFKYWQGKATKKSAGNRWLVQALEHMLAKHVVLKNPLRCCVAEEEQEFIMLTERQFNLLDFLKNHPRAAIGGCAGSGKTLMAAEKARRLALEEKRTLMVCYNKSLGEFLSSQLATIPSLVISHFHDLCVKLAKEAGITVPEKADDRFFSETLPEVLMQAVDAREDLKFDAIVIDEGQDFQEYWWLALQSTLKDPDKGIFYTFYDDNQAIYCENNCIPDDLPQFPLSENVRNTKSIFKLVSKFHKTGATITSRGPEGREVEMQTYTTKESLVKNLSKTLHKLINEEGLSRDDITVLSMKSISREGRSHLKDNIEAGNFTLCRTPTKPGEIRLSTVYAYKGLENKVIILTDIDSHVKSNQEMLNRLCYIGFSRARNHLILMGEEDTLNILTGK